MGVQGATKESCVDKKASRFSELTERWGGRERERKRHKERGRVREKEREREREGQGRGRKRCCSPWSPLHTTTGHVSVIN